jgi:hypothetical protein
MQGLGWSAPRKMRIGGRPQQGYERVIQSE